MKSKYFTVEVKPVLPVATQIQSNKTDLAFGAGDLLFDWTSFDVPKGVKDGERIFYGGFGNETLAGMGNLFITIIQKPHPIFTREDNNLLITKEVPFPYLIIGGSMEVQTLTGRIKVKIADNTKPMERLRIAGKGLNYENGVGDLIIILKPITPNKINDEEKSLLEKLKESENFNNIK